MIQVKRNGGRYKRPPFCVCLLDYFFFAAAFFAVFFAAFLVAMCLFSL